MLKIYLIRHAETDFNKENSGFSQSENMGLNNQGLSQLSKLSKILDKVKFDEVYSSNLPRAQRTAEILFKETKIIYDSRIKEYTHGTVSPESNIWKDKYDELLKAGVPKEEIRPFGGENIWDLIKRVKSFLKDLEKRSGTVAIIAHSGTNEVFLNLCMDKEKPDFFKFKQDNACVNVLEKNNVWSIKTLNDTRHLKDMEPEIEFYEDKDIVYNNLLNLIDKLNLSGMDTEVRILNDKIGKYKRVFRRYFTTPIEIFLNKPLGEDIKKKFKIVTILENQICYEIGTIIVNEIKYKVNLITPNNLEKFMPSEGDRKMISSNKFIK